MTLKLNVYSKDDLKKPVATGTDTDGAPITGLDAGTEVATGDYKASHTDDEGKLAESDKVDVPGFTVLGGDTTTTTTTADPNTTTTTTTGKVPEAPAVTAVAGDGKAEVTVSSVDGATSYNVYIKKKSDDWSTTPATTLQPDNLKTEITKLTNGTEYTIAATAVNAAGESAKSATGVDVTPQAPASNK